MTAAASNREHWEQHLCCEPINDAEKGDATASVYSGKNLDEAPFVLPTASQGPFSTHFKMSPRRAHLFAAALIRAAAAAAAAQSVAEAA